MTELRAISANRDIADTHIVFVHGLSGNIETTWRCKTHAPEVRWPYWLEEDIPGSAVWLVGYEAAKSNWGGYGISITDRGNSILARLLADPHLSRGNLIFVAHSLGGLIVKQVLRNAQRDAGSDRRAEQFLARARRVAFLGTPHRGSLLANFALQCRFLLRPTDSTHDLVAGSPQLKDLNTWYRQFSRDSGIQHLLLVEGKPASVCGISLPRFVGFSVSTESADGGLQETPITVDENHTGISKPDSRDAEVYVHLKDFISRPFDGGLEVTRTNEALENNTRELQRLSARADQQIAAIAELRSVIERRGAAQGVHTSFIDEEASRRLDRLVKCRVFVEFDSIEEARGLVASLEEGELALASEEQKGTVLAWCARLLSSVAPEEAAEVADRSRGAGDELHNVAQSLVKAARGALQDGIEELCNIGTPVAFSAAYICILRMRGLVEANEWLSKEGLSFVNLDSDGKFFYLRKSLEDGLWDVAFEAAKEVTEEECERSPALYFATADAFLMQAVPEELRTFFLQQNLPFEASKFPLRGDPTALEHRRRAIGLYERLHSFADSVGLPGVAGLMDDKALWLRLVDPESSAEAREELEKTIRNRETFLRRLGMGLQFGAEVDFEWAEREVDRQTELSGGRSPDAASARLALALSTGSHAAVAAYIDAHREQLLRHLDWRGVYFIEIEMLASAGQLAKADERLREAIERGLSEQEIARLCRHLSEAGGADPIAERLAAYEEGGSIVDLRILVAAYEEAEDWQNACEYGAKLVEASGDLGDARRYVIGLYNFERQEDALQVMGAFPGLCAEDEALRLLRAQMLFECGKLSEAARVLRNLGESSDSSEARQLQINLAVVSGDWESLQGFVEDEWNARDDRTAPDLLRAGQIAGHIGAARGEELVREAAGRAGDDPAILVGCFHVASAAGWEGSVEVHRWIERAAELSSGDGSVQAMPLEEILDRKPDWERRESTAWDLLEKGEAPVFVAGQILNRSLLSLYLMPALNNLSEADVRKRSMIYAFSGARGKARVTPTVVAMDATALISAEFLDLLDVCIDEFDNIVIPHSTLGWLLGEKARSLFHQPSRVVAARELRTMIAGGQLRAFEGSNIAPERLVNEVDYPLAMLIAEALSTDHPDTRQRLVVRGGPVHKASSLMQEEADLKDYEAYLCSGFAVVEMLARKGVLTAREARDACNALSVREVKWSNEPRIADEAVLYLDDLAVSHLQHLGLLSKLHRGDVTAYVSLGEIEEADALISYDERANEVVEVVERLRRRLRQGLESGKVRLGKAIRGDDPDDSGHVASHPTVDMLRLVADADVGVVDDRFVNRHGVMSLETVNRPLLTTVDLLDVLVERGSISVERRQDALTRLRQANFALTPLTVEELHVLVSNSRVSGGTVEETAELRAIREGIQRVQMSNMLQSPQELTWLNGVIQACLVCLKEQWNDGFDEATAVARSDWLLALGDVRAWTHRLDDNVEQLAERYRNWVLVLMTLPARQHQSVKEAYWRWLDSRVLEPLQEEDPETYQYLVEWAQQHVAGSVESCERGLEDGDDQRSH